MWEEFLLKDVLGVFDPFLPGDSWFGSTDTNKIESNILFLNNEGFIKRRFKLDKKNIDNNLP